MLEGVSHVQGSVSENGTLVYVPGRAVTSNTSPPLYWFNRRGETTPIRSEFEGFWAELRFFGGWPAPGAFDW